MDGTVLAEGGTLLEFASISPFKSLLSKAQGNLNISSATPPPMGRRMMKAIFKDEKQTLGLISKKTNSGLYNLQQSADLYF